MARGGGGGVTRRRVHGPVVIGPGCRVEAGSRLGEYTVLASNVRVMHDVQIDRSVIHENVYVGPGSGCAAR